jgi:hypothetical protein
LTQATTLLTTHGREKAQYLLTFSSQAAQATRYAPQVFGGILHYTDRALAAYDVQITQATTRQTAATDRTRREQYAQWRQERLAQLRAALPLAELAALEAAHQARLMAAGTPAYALGLAVRVAVDEVLEVRASLPSFEAWRHTQEVGG